MTPGPVKIVKIVEVGPRDGLQNEAASIPTAVKVAFVDALSTRGIRSSKCLRSSARNGCRTWRTRQRCSRHHPDPARATRRSSPTSRVSRARFRGARRRDRHLRRGVGGVQPERTSTRASTRQSTLPRRLRGREECGHSPSAPMCQPRSAVHSRELSIRRPSLGCPPQLIGMGAYEVSSVTRADCASRTDPIRRGRRRRTVPIERIALHFHDTRGTALANVLAALHLGIATFDSSAGGLGGCLTRRGPSGTRPRGPAITCSTVGDDSKPASAWTAVVEAVADHRGRSWDHPAAVARYLAAVTRR